MGPTMGDVLVIVGGVVSFTIFMIVKDDLLSWATRFVKRDRYRHAPLMSSSASDQTNDRRIDENPVNTLSAWQSRQPVNERQPVNGGNESNVNELHDIIDAAAREKDLQYRERLATLADMINAGLSPQTEGIERAFGCTRSGRKDSKYALIRADLLPLLKSKEAPPATTPIAGRHTSATFAELTYEPPDAVEEADDTDLVYCAP